MMMSIAAQKNFMSFFTKGKGKGKGRGDMPLFAFLVLLHFLRSFTQMDMI